jgi:hypothetical protein
VAAVAPALELAVVQLVGPGVKLGQLALSRVRRTWAVLVALGARVSGPVAASRLDAYGRPRIGWRRSGLPFGIRATSDAAEARQGAQQATHGAPVSALGQSSKPQAHDGQGTQPDWSMPAQPGSALFVLRRDR